MSNQADLKDKTFIIQELYNKGDFNEALKLSSDLSKDYSNNSFVQNLHGFILIALHNWEICKDYFLKAIKINNNFQQAYNNLGLSELNLGNFEKALENFLKAIKGFDKIKVLGAGSNTLIRDGGFDGIIIKFGKPFAHVSLFDENTIVAGSSILDKAVSNFALENSLSGFEFLSCIPGSIGGGIRMNSGCYGEDISKILLSVQVMDFDGKMRVVYSSNIKFSYRGCNLDPNLIFISSTFKGKKDIKENIKKKIDLLINKKKQDQPSKIKTCGSTFKNPQNNKAWKLI